MNINKKLNKKLKQIHKNLDTRLHKREVEKWHADLAEQVKQAEAERATKTVAEPLRWQAPKYKPETEARLTVLHKEAKEARVRETLRRAQEARDADNSEALRAAWLSEHGVPVA